MALTAVKLGPSDRERIASLATIKKRTPHYLMKEAILEYVQREEARQNFIGAAETSFEHFKETGSIKEKTTTSKGVGKS